MASGKIDSLWVELGVKGVGQSTLTDFIKGLGMIKMGSLAAGGTLGALMGMVNESASAAVSFQSFSNATALSTDQLQLWQNAAVLANDSTEGMTAAVTTLQQRLQAIKMGKFDPAFFKLGVVPGKTADTFDVLRRVMARRGTMPAADYSAFVSELGLGGIQNTLARGGKGLAEAGGIPVMGQGDIQQYIGLVRDFKDMWLDARTISRQIAKEFIEPLSLVINTIDKILHGSMKAHELAAAGGPSMVETMFGIPTTAIDKFFGMDKKSEAAAAAGRGTVSVTITGDRNDAGFATRVAEEVGKITGMTADQIPVESPDNYVIPGIPKSK